MPIKYILNADGIYTLSIARIRVLVTLCTHHTNCNIVCLLKDVLEILQNLLYDEQPGGLIYEC